MGYEDRWAKREKKAWHIFIKTDKGWATPNIQFRFEQEAQIEALLQHERNPDIVQHTVRECTYTEARNLVREWNG